MKIFLDPNDVLMFRDGRPFSGGDDHFARGIFPPLPSTIYGALRTKILSEAFPEYERFGASRDEIPPQVRTEVGNADSPGSLSIRMICIGKRVRDGVSAYFQAPADLVREKGGNGSLILLPAKQKTEGLPKTNIPGPLKHLWYPTENALENISGYLEEGEMLQYLEGKVPENLTSPGNIFESEPRIGIMKDRISRTVSTGKLYSVEYFRLAKDVGFLVEVAGTTLLPKEGLLRLGGDHRSVFYREVPWEPPSSESIDKMVCERSRFKMVLLTPAIFRQGWLPKSIDPMKFEGDLGGMKVKLASAAMGRPIGVGGFDLAKQYPKPMRKAVPAGTVFYFDILGNSATQSNLANFRASPFTDDGEKEGYGIFIIGGW